MSTKEGNLQAPKRDALDWQNPEFYDEASLYTEMERVFDVCHGCRRCVSLCLVEAQRVLNTRRKDPQKVSCHGDGIGFVPWRVPGDRISESIRDSFRVGRPATLEFGVEPAVAPGLL